MRVLIGCEKSGRVREAFRALGHDAYSCDLQPAEDGSPFHIVGDVLEVGGREGWDLGLFHPPCTFLCSSGLHWNKRRPERREQTEQALAFVLAIAALRIPRRAIENPTGCLSTRWRKPTQIVQPYHFGDDASKATCLWLDNLPPLRPTAFVEPRMVNGKPRWANQTDSGQNRLGPSETRAADRARTYQGIATAMAQQWGNT